MADSTRRSGSRNSSDYGSVNQKLVSTGDNENVKRRGDHNLNCRCRQPQVVCSAFPPDCCCSRIALSVPFLNNSGVRLGRKDNANHIYVNLKYLQETAAAALSSQGIPGKLIPYYANLHFLQTLSLYENADILDVRPHLFPSGDGDKEKTSERPIPKKKIDPPSNNGVYEMMSFNQSEFAPSVSENYLLMQPGGFEHRGELVAAEGGSAATTTTPATTTSTARDSTQEEEGEGRESTVLPLRPFMPVLLPFHEHTCEGKDNPECDDSCKSTCGRKCGSSRSNSLGDIKVSVFRRGRSSSTDGRQEGLDEGCPALHASPKSTPVRKHPILTKLSLRSREKSFSTDEITPPSSAPSSPDSMFLESIHKYPFHRSADCLQLNEECRLSEEDLSQDPEAIMSQSMDKARLSASIKRSSSVPCKTNPNQQQHSASSTDSGISTHIPPLGQAAVFSHFIAYHGSLPRRHTGNAASRHPVLPDRKLSSFSGKAQSQQEQKVATDQSKMIFISECKQCHQFVTSPEGLVVLDAKSMTSSSSSDMSDYVESLSLCSRSSSGSGSSGCGGAGPSEYIHTDDLCNALMKIPTTCTSNLRPRSGKEYHSFDRVLIQDGCPYIPIADCSHLNLSCLRPFTEDPNQEETGTEETTTNANFNSAANNNIVINNNKTNSPSPGYMSSSPGNVEFASSPEKTSHFTFPKDGKELNYLEVVSVGESEPTSPVVKQGSVQYAVIDMVATSAARKLSTERAQLRNEGKSPTPTECSPKHAGDDQCTSEK